MWSTNACRVTQQLNLRQPLSPYEQSGRRSLEIVKLSGLSTRSLVQGWTGSTKVGEAAAVAAQRLPEIGDASQLVAPYAAWG